MGKRIPSRKRGKGSPLYRSPSHRHHGMIKYHFKGFEKGVVQSITHDPGRTAPVAEVKFEEKIKRLIAPDGLEVNQQITAGGDEIARGNIMEIQHIPTGTYVYNIELKPGDGGKLVRAAGTAATIVSQSPSETIIQLPSGKFKSINPRCLATIGVVAGAGRIERPFGKAGKKYHAYRSKAKVHLRVKGIVKNPVYHPHGGGAHPHVGGASTISAGAHPGQKVGRFAPKRKRKRS
jgi:large subunit ribosomal protein L2